MVMKAKVTAEMWSVGPIVDSETGEIVVKAGAQIGDSVSLIQAGKLKKVEVIEIVEIMSFSSAGKKEDRKYSKYEELMIIAYMNK